MGGEGYCVGSLVVRLWRTIVREFTACRVDWCEDYNYRHGWT